MLAVLFQDLPFCCAYFANLALFVWFGHSPRWVLSRLPFDLFFRDIIVVGGEVVLNFRFIFFFFSSDSCFVLLFSIFPAWSTFLYTHQNFSNTCKEGHVHFEWNAKNYREGKQKQKKRKKGSNNFNWNLALVSHLNCFPVKNGPSVRSYSWTLR